MKQRLLSALGQFLLVVTCASIIPSGAILVLRLSGNKEPEMFGWAGALLLIQIYAPMSGVGSALALGTNAFLERSLGTWKSFTAILVGSIHGALFLLAVLSSSWAMLFAAVGLSLTVIVMCIFNSSGKK